MGRLDERRYAAAVLDAAVGGGMSSRLFQEIREKRGLVYSVGSALTHYAGAGAFSVYAGCSQEAGARGAAADPRGARPGGRRRASPPRRSPAAAASSRAAWCSGWRTPGRG